jgi:hypothetical protein
MIKYKITNGSATIEFSTNEAAVAYNQQNGTYHNDNTDHTRCHT